MTRSICLFLLFKPHLSPLSIRNKAQRIKMSLNLRGFFPITQDFRMFANLFHAGKILSKSMFKIYFRLKTNRNLNKLLEMR